MDEYLKQHWLHAISATLEGNNSEQARFTGSDQILRVLNLFCRFGTNLAFNPRGGQHSLEFAERESGEGLIALYVEENAAWVCKPTTLYFEHFEASPFDSFLLLEIDDIPPLFNSSDECKDAQDYEEVIEFRDGRCIDRDQFEQEMRQINDRVEPHRTLSRYLKGKFLIMSPLARYNSIPLTNQERRQHSQMSSSQIREQIDSIIGIS